MRDLEQDARTVAGVGLIAHPASMRHPFEHVDRLVDQNVALFPIGLHDHTDPAGVVLKTRVIQPLCPRQGSSRLRCRRNWMPGHIRLSHANPSLRK